jgi:hypothetical protein
VVGHGLVEQPGAAGPVDLLRLPLQLGQEVVDAAGAHGRTVQALAHLPLPAQQLLATGDQAVVVDPEHRLEQLAAHAAQQRGQPGLGHRLVVSGSQGVEPPLPAHDLQRLAGGAFDHRAHPEPVHRVEERQVGVDGHAVEELVDRA